MNRWFAGVVALVLASSWGAAQAQSPQRSTEAILSFDIYGINARMAPETARRLLLGAGFTEKGAGEAWDKVPVATFTKDNVRIGLGHRAGKITGISATQIAQGEAFDYSKELARIKAHFAIADKQERACLEREYGAQCGLRDGQPKGARFMASLTAQMIFLQVGAPQ